jgi:hypothetical protein
MFAYIMLLLCVAIHPQIYAPSTPGGYYYGTNGTSSGIYTIKAPNTTTLSSPTEGGIYINGVPYQYTGPFTLVCYYVGSSTDIFRYDSCTDSFSCANMINDYRNCKGTVKRFINWGS